MLENMNFQQLIESQKITGMNDFLSSIEKTFKKFNSKDIISRIWDVDYTVWKDKSDEITNRLGWLQSPGSTLEVISDINHFVDQVRAEGFTHALLLGMGGSSLAPEVFRKTFNVEKGYLDLYVLDSTEPGAILNREKEIILSKTLFIVSTKSGGTVETISFMKYFYNKCLESVGKEHVGKHFVAITDPGSGLESIAKSLNFRKIFLNDPDIGGRYSALSFFGIIPAALIGADIKKILERSIEMAKACQIPDSEKNPGAWLGIILGELAKKNREKITFLISPEIKHIGGWLEQLIAESTGKEGVGILPIDGEEILTTEYYADDRLFIYIQLKNESNLKVKFDAIQNDNNPCIVIGIEDLYDIGAEFFRWEFATIVASKLLNINPFDQPNVESAKVLGRKFISEFQEKGQLPNVDYNFKSHFLKVNAPRDAHSLNEILYKFLQQKNEIESKTNKKVYISLQAYLAPSFKIDEMMHKIRTAIQKKWKVATTVGYGPRFLHSTGQLHKGDAGNGMFIQIIGDIVQDVPIPDNAGETFSSITFGTLVKAQALGDRQALINESREVLLIDIGNNYEKGLIEFLENI
jgi:glucose-6-phosphate isomerase